MRRVVFTGGIIVNSGTLRSGINTAFASQLLTVRPAGTFDLQGFTNTNTALNVQSGFRVGAQVTGTGTLTLTAAAGVSHSLNGDGTTGATISANLALPTTATILVANGLATDDLTVSGVVSAVNTTLTKSGAGTLVLSNANTYSRRNGGDGRTRERSQQ